MWLYEGRIIMKITWLPTFETGIANIDNDHKALVEVIQKIDSTLGAGNVEACLQLFHEFQKAAAEHFEREETLLESIAFPRLESHRMAHNRLLGMAEETMKMVKPGLDHEKAAKCLEEMAYFLLEDVIKTDAEFKSYAQDKGLI